MVLIHSGSRILPEVSESLSAYALQKLRSQGVEVLLETRVLGCADDCVRLSAGGELLASTIVWAAGTAPSPILDRLHLQRTKAGKIEVDATMAVSGHPGLWAVGDSAAIPDVAKGGYCPPTAQHALRQGRRLAQNIAAVLGGRKAEPFKYKALGVLASLGRRSAVAEILGFQFSGFVAWWLFRTIYLMKLPGFERKLRVAIDWTLDMFFQRDTVYLRPLHTAHGPRAISHEQQTNSQTSPVASHAPQRPTQPSRGGRSPAADFDTVVFAIS